MSSAKYKRLLFSTVDQTSIVLVAPLEDAAMTVVLEVQARNPPYSDDRRNTANQEYIIVVTDGTLCYVELEPTSYSVHETTNLKKGEYIVKINGTSNCEDISFEYQISSQILTFFNGQFNLVLCFYFFRRGWGRGVGVRCVGERYSVSIATYNILLQRRKGVLVEALLSWLYFLFELFYFLS